MAPQQQIGSATAQHLQQQFEYGTWYLLCLWQALHVAVQNNWGGPNTADKRDWFAGAVTDLVAARCDDLDADDIEAFLLQVMLDEFETVVEDGTAAEVAAGIVGLWQRLVCDGDATAFREVEERWRNRGAMKTDVRVVQVDQDVDEDDASYDDDEEFQGFPDDVEMVDSAEAPTLISAMAPAHTQKPPQPEVDADGFTKVVSRKKR